jgi:hypothetical protein
LSFCKQIIALFQWIVFVMAERRKEIRGIVSFDGSQKISRVDKELVVVLKSLLAMSECPLRELKCNKL